MGHGLAAAAAGLQQQQKQQQQHAVTWSWALLISRHLTLYVSGILVRFRGLLWEGSKSGWGASSAGVPSADPLNCVAMVIVLPAAPKLPVSNT
jgi:hypothetical protein